MKSVNKVILIGRLGRDAEQTFTQSQKSVTKFSVATDYSYKSGDEWKTETTWTDITLWGNEKLVPYLTKGTLLYVEGRLQNQSWQGKDGEKKYKTVVVADSVGLLGGKNDGNVPAKSSGGDDYQSEDTPF